MKQTRLKTFLNNFTLTHMSKQYHFTEHDDMYICTVAHIERDYENVITKIVVKSMHRNETFNIKHVVCINIDDIAIGDICQIRIDNDGTETLLYYVSALQYDAMNMSPQDKIVSLINMIDTPIGRRKYNKDVITLAQALKDDYDVKQESDNTATCGGFAVTEREYFVHGDIVIDTSGTAYIYNSPVGFDKASVIDIDGNHLEINIIDNGPLQFHPDFTPGLIAEKFS